MRSTTLSATSAWTTNQEPAVHISPELKKIA